MSGGRFATLVRPSLTALRSNADPLVLQAADHVAPSNDDDGVARVLASVFGLAPAPVVE